MVVAGGAQSGTVSSLLTDSIRVQLGDAFGNPIAGTTVDFFISAGGGAATPLVAATNAAGEASTRWTLGTLVGTQQMTVTVPGFPGVQVIVSATASSAAAAPLLSWTGAVNNNWGVTGNWSLGRLPLPSDSVFIAPSVADTVEINVSTTVAFLVVSGTAPVLINHTLGATLQVDSVAVFNSNSTFNMSGGSVLTGNGGVQFAGPLNWNGGTMSGTGLSIVAAGATALIASTGAVTLNGRDLVVSGTANIGGSGVGTANFPIITVFPSGTLAFTTAASFFVSASDTLRIVNAGTLRKAASAGTVRIDWTIDNSGLLDVQAGVLDLRNTLTVGGSVIIRTGGSLQSRGHTELNGSLSLENGGNVQFTAGGIAPAR